MPKNSLNAKQSREQTKTADLRDLFAGQAMAAMIGPQLVERAATSGEGDLMIPIVCTLAYAFADGMMIERAKRIYRRELRPTPDGA
jgi:hypothetical protein